MTGKDYELIAEAQKAIRLNYDELNYCHTVGSAVRCKNGKIYIGVNVYSLHGACAEQVAIGTAITNGERDFETIVAVRGKRGEEMIPPCGNCRQIDLDADGFTVDSGHILFGNLCSLESDPAEK